MTVDLQKAFRKLEAAAIAGARCPLNDEHDGANGVDKRAVSQLAKDGRILVEVSSRNWRQVTILTGSHAGRRTAPNPDKNARVHLTVDASGTKINGKLIDTGANGRSQPSAPRPLTSEELSR